VTWAFTFRSSTTVLYFLAAFLLARSALAESDAPLHYYDSAIGQTGAALKSALQSIIRNQTVIPYTAVSTDTWDAVKLLDQDPFDPLDILLIYSGFSVPKSEQSNGSTGTWARDHLWPQSYGITAWNGNSRAKSDLFNLRPIDTNVNSSRGNKYYDYSTTPISTHPEAPGSSADPNSWEPRDADKGAVARAMFYMAVRYDGTDPDVPDLELSDSPNAAQYRFGKLTTVSAWHRQFPVAAPEQERNQRIYSDYQHNRNPFIDHPDYAEMVFYGISPGQAWRRTRFTDPELADPSMSGDAADPDGDGVKNLLEYVFNRDPWQPEPTPAITVSVTSQGGSYHLFVSFPHNRNATDVAVSYEASSDLQTWTPVTPAVVSNIVLSSENEQITRRFPAPAPTYFVRIRATRASP